MLFRKICQTALLFLATGGATALATNGQSGMTVHPYKREALQGLVTWDEHSLFVRGERILFYSGEFHPFRLPVPGLWLDVFQKIKALGYNGVSFYTDWALHEGKPGNFSAEGIFGYDAFFDAAKTAGIYLLARPGPYINAEVSGGGYPGWMQRNPALLRTRDPRYLAATENYVTNIAQIIAKAQITNGGPVVLVQPENEYSQADPNVPDFPDAVYFGYVEDQLRNNGIVVPFISNDASPFGFFAAGPPRQPNATDIYGHDGYPLGFDCANPTQWPVNKLPTNYGDLHQLQSPSTPYSIVEFQAGSFDPWGGSGFDACTELLGPEFERVFYKNDFSFGVTIFNLYMTYGGTNWGNLGHPGGYTSYDYGAVIAEDRSVTREKYSQAKLLANFLMASPAYLTAVPQNNSSAAGDFTGNSAVFTTALLANSTNFFVVRHSDYTALDTIDYSITLPTSRGNVTIPQLGGKLSLRGRDSKIYVTDYDVGGINLLYSTAEIFTWKRDGRRSVLILYTGPGETNEFAISDKGQVWVTEGEDVTISSKGDAKVINFATSSSRRIVQFSCGLVVYILDRQSTYNYWVIEAPNDKVTGNYSSASHSTSAPIIKAGYLVRTIAIEGPTMAITGDLNATTTLEVIGGAPSRLRSLAFNGQSVRFTQGRDSVVNAQLIYNKPEITLPDLSTVGWMYIDSLPETQPEYDDSLWTAATLAYSNNTARNLTTPCSLYASDYGYHTGNILYRGHFTSNGNETTLFLETEGGLAFGHSVWLNSTYIGSYVGSGSFENYNTTLSLPKLTRDSSYVFTILVDNMGLDEDYRVGSEGTKLPRGVLDYNLSGHTKSDVVWKLTGNLHGEDYEDPTRGPLNEGGLFAERQGYHLPGAPIHSWKSSALGPMEGTSSAGVSFYATDITLNMPKGYDIPLSLVFENSTTTSYRSQIYVNGYQFGKYVSNIGPQKTFPVPEGIWNYHGSNRIAVSLWALEGAGAKVSKLSLIAGPAILSGFGTVELSPMTGWSRRNGAY